MARHGLRGALGLARGVGVFALLNSVAFEISF